jgi:hypothetical protein
MTLSLSVCGLIFVRTRFPMAHPTASSDPRVIGSQRRRAAFMIEKELLEIRIDGTVDRLEAMSVIVGVNETGSLSAKICAAQAPRISQFG